MNPLAALSYLEAYIFLFTGFYFLNLERERGSGIAAAHNMLVAWWTFCYGFMYSAATPAQAWFWHRLSSPSWCFFVPVASHFFFSFSGLGEGKRRFIVLPLFYALPLLLAVLSLTGESTVLIAGLTRGDGESSWRYVANSGSIWFWAFFAGIIAYFSLGVFSVYRWGKTNGHPNLLMKSRAFIFVELAAFLCGITTDMLIPAFGLRVPMTANFVVAVWGLGFLVLMRRYRQESLRREATQAMILKTVMDPVLLLSERGAITQCNAAAARVLGVPGEGLIGKPFAAFIESRAYNRETVNILFRDKRINGVMTKLKDARGRIVPMIASYSVAESDLDGIIGIVASFHDISGIKRTEAELRKRQTKYLLLSRRYERLANYDALTGLPNRRLFFERLDASLGKAVRTGTGLLVAFIDLDGFKAINDRWGHDAGDKALAAAAARFRSLVKPPDFAARVGGDEFVILVKSDLGAERLEAAIAAAFRDEVDIGPAYCRIGASVGFCRCPEDGTRADDLLQAADDRMYECKRRRRESGAEARG